ncbi:MAG: cryptochrome/photolyase family protein [Gammaproteobacteria bacterium]
MPTDAKTALVWLRRDLRTEDHPALQAAIRSGLPVRAVYIHDPDALAPWQAGGATRWYLHHSLIALQNELAQLGIPVHCMRGDTETALLELIRTHKAECIFWNRVVEPEIEALDAKIRSALDKNSIRHQSFEDDCLLPPEQVRKPDGTPYRVFTPFWKLVSQRLREDLPSLLDAPQACGPAVTADPTQIDALGLLEGYAWYPKLHQHWQPGSAHALKMLDDFLEGPVEHYAEMRDVPGVQGTSRLSTALHFGEISARRIFVHGEPIFQNHPDSSAREGARRFLAEVGWREFARHVLHAFPHSANESLDARFEDASAWRTLDTAQHDEWLDAWKRGETGVDLVDAGMRELWETGWMHNRVRMVVGSYLTKNLGISWHEGARWFWDTLVDADLASNTLGWQWVSGCGTDAAPYYRIFNPDMQAEKFDPDRIYIERWLGNRVLRPNPLIDLKTSRAQALERFQQLKQVA